MMNDEMGTYINDINKTPAFEGQMNDKDINNLINNIENNIQKDNLTNNNINIQQNNIPTYNPTYTDPIYKPVIQQQKPIINNVIQKEKKKSFIMTNIKEFIIIILLFSIFAYRGTNKILYLSLPMITKIESPLPSLFIRGFIFALTIKLIKKLFF